MGDFMSAEMYREHILEHYRNPHNFGYLENPDKVHTEVNHVCGDSLTIQISLENEKIKEVRFNGHGCAISMASASLLTDDIKDKNIKEIKLLNKEYLLGLLKIPISHARLKCALLPLDALLAALKK